jgi:hypothetical protein
MLVAPQASAASIGTAIRSGNFSITGYANAFSPPFTLGTEAQRTYTAPEGNGSSSITVDYGSISAFATFTTPAGSSDSNFVNTAGYFADTLTIDAPGLTGTSGTLQFSFTIGGSLTSSGALFNKARANYTFGTDVGDGVIPNSFTFSGNFVEAYDPLFINPGQSGRFWEVPQTQTIGFTYGTPFDFYFVLEAAVEHGRDGSIPGTSTANVSLLDWSGFKNMKDSGGQDVSNATIYAPASNVDWTRPVPEPGSLGLLALGAALVGLRRRREKASVR